jgi:hypothetical protein
MRKSKVKKLLCLLLLGTMILSLTACGGGGGNKAPQAKGTPIYKSYDETKNIIDAIWNFPLTIEGKEFKLPFSVKELTDAGWKFPDTDQTIPYGMSNEYVLTKDDLSLMVEVKNSSENKEKLPAQECTVYGITVGAPKLDKMPDIKMLEDISLKSGLAEVKEAYGDFMSTYPVDQYDESKGSYYVYGGFPCPQLRFVVKDDVICGFNVESCFVEDFANLDGKDVDTKLLDYTPPSALSDDYNEGIIEIGGKLLQMPFPAYELIQDGWVICSSGETFQKRKESGSQRYDGRSLIFAYKGRDALTVFLVNYTDQEVAHEMGSVRNVKSVGRTCSIKIAGGITLGSPCSELVRVFGDKAEEGGTRGVSVRTDLFNYEIKVKDGVVSSIEIGYNDF